jgi:nitroreductase
MSFLDLARSRRAIRAYKLDPVPEEQLLQVLEAARVAPSACNNQPWHFIILRDSARREAMKAAYDRAWLWSAPVVIAACADTTACWRRGQDGKLSADIDVAIAMDHLTLCARELGLGTCWVCAFDPVAARRVLELPDHVQPIALTPLGYPAEEGRPLQRKPLEEIVCWESWNGPEKPKKKKRGK